VYRKLKFDRRVLGTHNACLLGRRGQFSDHIALKGDARGPVVITIREFLAAIESGEVVVIVGARAEHYYSNPRVRFIEIAVPPVDEGGGIPEEDVENIFSKFNRVQKGDHVREGALAWVSRSLADLSNLFMERLRQRITLIAAAQC
jgi:hypothetical protein